MTPTVVGWADALVFLFFAYGGFESGIINLGEAKNPERDAPFALFVALGDATVKDIQPHMTTTTFCRALCPSDGFLLDNDWVD